jgi:DEAD/DEAH box helicase domain-containing protein
MSLDRLITRWKTDPTIATNIAAWKRIPAQPAILVKIPAGLNEDLVSALHQQGITELYSHQAEAFEQVSAGKSIAIVTSTASGKTLAFNLPVLNELITSHDATAFYIYPTKALAQDQLDELATIQKSRSLQNYPPLRAAVYDGDTPTGARSAIRKQSRVILTNPDMLHTGILPHHTAWADFMRGLRYVVIDEMHAYRGVFGSHVANVIRRLKRIARFYGAEPRFILASATIQNPSDLAEKLTEEQVVILDKDGSGKGEKNFLIYNPPLVDEELGIRRSLLQESVRLTEDLLAYNLQTVVFGRARRSIELALTYLRSQTADNPSNLVPTGEDTIRGYRSGYLPSQRREIERGLRSGEIRIVVATNALELGIDIGDLEAAILAGYPGTIASTWQQAGRAGRGINPGLSVLVVSANPLDQYLARNPDYFFSRSPEQALINPDNLLILLGHIRCAAFELPFKTGENFGKIEPSVLKDLLDFLKTEGVLHQSGERYFWMSEAYPAQGISLRNAAQDAIVLQAELEGNSRIIGTVDAPSASWMVHPGAVYLHEGQMYLVESLDLENKHARLTAFNGDYYTEPSRDTNVQVIEEVTQSPETGCLKAYGELLVTSKTIGFKRRRWYTSEMLGFGEVELPPHELYTTGYWIRIDEVTVEKLNSEGLWNNFPNQYGPGWPSLREQVRKRDQYICQVCGQTEAGRGHDVHHIIPFRSFATSNEANQLSNLITLCPSCHRKAETAVRMRSSLAGLAYAMANLAPLFLMCDPRDLGMHYDPQSVFSGQEADYPGLVLYDQVPAGIGLSERIYEIHTELLQKTLELINTCPCPDGCPSCVGPGGENGTGGKEETLALLKALVV